jgi:hypothetical protein
MGGKIPANELREIQELVKTSTAPLPFAVLMLDTSGNANGSTFYRKCTLNLREALVKASASLLLSLPATDPAQVKQNLEAAIRILPVDNLDSSNSDIVKQICCDMKLKREAAVFYIKFFKLSLPKDTSSFFIFLVLCQLQTGLFVKVSLEPISLLL